MDDGPISEKGLPVDTQSGCSPLTVVCRYCGVQLTLTADSGGREAGGWASSLGRDPCQQLHAHVYRHGPMAEADHARRLAWLVDMLWFECPADPERWRANIDRMITLFQSESVRNSREAAD